MIDKNDNDRDLENIFWEIFAILLCAKNAYFLDHKERTQSDWQTVLGSIFFPCQIFTSPTCWSVACDCTSSIRVFSYGGVVVSPKCVPAGGSVALELHKKLAKDSQKQRSSSYRQRWNIHVAIISRQGRHIKATIWSTISIKTCSLKWPPP